MEPPSRARGLRLHPGQSSCRHGGRHTTIVNVFQYVYDFGDDWRHKVDVETVISAQLGLTYPCCTDDRRPGPPDDCGGVWSYQEFLVAVADARHPQHETVSEWVGGSFYPDAFDPGDFNQQLDMGSLAL